MHAPRRTHKQPRARMPCMHAHARRTQVFLPRYPCCWLTPTLLWRVFMSPSGPSCNGRSTPTRSYCTKVELIQTHILGMELGSMSFRLTTRHFEHSCDLPLDYYSPKGDAWAYAIEADSKDQMTRRRLHHKFHAQTPVPASS